MVCVDNWLFFQIILLGIIVDFFEGLKQKYWYDFFNYVGIYCDVWLCCCFQVYIEDVIIIIDIDGNDGIVIWLVFLYDVEFLMIWVIIFDIEGNVVVGGISVNVYVCILLVYFWQLGYGYFYEVEIFLVDGDQVIDIYQQVFGV